METIQQKMKSFEASQKIQEDNIIAQNKKNIQLS
jgi:hypothetical protein